MSSTIHSLGPKSANGLSCEVCWVDTAALVLSTGWAPDPGFRLRAPLTRLTPAGTSRTRPALVTVVYVSADVALPGDEDPDDAGHHGVSDEHGGAGPLGQVRRFVRPAGRDHELGGVGGCH